jgi:hypothetical protein
VVDGVAWDYDPARERLSPLVSARRWFRDFPWELKATLVDRPGAVRDDPADRGSAADPT